MDKERVGEWEQFLHDEYNTYKSRSKVNLGCQFTISDFITIRTLGVGSYGRVALAKLKEYQGYFAIKIMDKERIIRTRQHEHVLNERRILQSIDCPFIIKSEFTFKDNCYLYIVMPFESGGEMFTFLRQCERFSEEVSKFYAAQVVLALEYLHFMKLAYRDLKPENILMCRDGYLKLVDLGFCKTVLARTYTLCGTPEYMAPEIVLSQGHGRAVDWWALGVLVYEMCAGSSPFYALDLEDTFKACTQGNYDHKLLRSEDVKDLVNRLLQVTPSKRLGNLGKGAADVKNHPWFSQIVWLELFKKRIVPPYQPRPSRPGDASYYDTQQEKPLKSCSEMLFEKEFEDF